jgi:RNase P subunit RPR2
MENERYFRSQTEEEIKEFDELQAKKDEIILLLKSGDIEGAVKIQQEFCVPAEMITELSDIYGIIEQSILDELIQGEFKKIGAIKDSFLISDEDIAQIAEKAILFSIVEKDIAIAKEIQQEFSISDEIVQETAIEGVIDRLKRGYIYKAKQIQQEFSISDDIIQSPEVQEAVKEGFIYELQRGDIRAAKEIQQEFSISDDIVQEAAREGFIDGLKRGYIYKVKQIQQEFSISDDIIQSPEVQEAVKEGFIYELQRGDIRAAKEIQQEFSISDDIIQSPEVQEAVKEGFIHELRRGDIRSAKQIQQEFSISDDIIQSPEVQEAAKERIIYHLQRGDMLGDVRTAQQIRQEFSISDDIIQSPEVQEAAKESLIYHLQRGDMWGDIYKAQQIQQEFALSDDIIQSPEVQEAAKEGLIYKLKRGYIDEAKEIQQEFSVLIEEDMREIIETSFIFSVSTDTSFQKISISLDNYTEAQLAEMWSKAQEFKSWQDEHTVKAPFEAGVEIFGYKRMLQYIKREGLSLHDAVHTFRDVIDLYNISELGESEFYGQILQQVMMDTREYDEGNAHQHFNRITQTMNKDIAGVLSKAKQYNEVQRLQDLILYFNNPQAVFSSWSNLKRYSEIEQLLGQTEILDELKALKAEGKEKLYTYIETLAFHPDSKVNMQSVMQFWRDPESFLAADASHTPYEIHDRKKPSNYIDIPNLDLTASELRDALVEGKMDGLSVFTPLEIRYTIPIEDMQPEPFPDLVNKALGSSKKGIAGEARNPRKLFNELGKLLKPHGVGVIEYIQGQSLPEDIHIDQQIQDLIYNPEFGMKKLEVKTRDFIAKISQKSDPEGAMAGDDTVNCMPFGDGKNTLYTFNPNTAQFVIRAVKGDGKERTIAQSVLTKDLDVQKPVPYITQQLEHTGGHLESVLSENLVINAPVYLACDNIEVAPNYSDERYKQIIEAIYKDFFREYMTKYSSTQNLNPNKVPIGMGYTDILSTLPTESNTFIPQAPVSYSDKTGEDVYTLDLRNEEDLNLILNKAVKETEVEAQVEVSIPNIKGLDYLTFEDTLKASYLEGKAYSDNQGLMQFLANMENSLIAKDINNAAKDRPNMSLKYIDEAGRIRGYMLSWEGYLADTYVQDNIEDLSYEPCIYIMDLATDLESSMAGGRLIQGFIELYQQNYLDKGNLMPIFTQAREATSYKIIKRQLDRLGQSTGFTFELVELPTYKVGNDIMHPVIISPVST